MTEEEIVELPEGITDPSLHLKCLLCGTHMWGIIKPVGDNAEDPPRIMCESCEKDI